jgi:hypothetical protein
MTLHSRSVHLSPAGACTMVGSVPNSGSESSIDIYSAHANPTPACTPVACSMPERSRATRLIPARLSESAPAHERPPRARVWSRAIGNRFRNTLFCCRPAKTTRFPPCGLAEYGGDHKHRRVRDLAARAGLPAFFCEPPRLRTSPYRRSATPLTSVRRRRLTRTWRRCANFWAVSLSVWRASCPTRSASRLLRS